MKDLKLIENKIDLLTQKVNDLTMNSTLEKQEKRLACQELSESEKLQISNEISEVFENHFLQIEDKGFIAPDRAADNEIKSSIIQKALMKVKEVLKESDSNYPDFDLNKNIRYKDTSISSGMWRYTGQEQGGAGVYRNLNNGQILGFDRSDFDIFKNNLSSHFDISESINEDIYDKFLDNPSLPKGRAKSLILKFTKEYGDDASSMAVDRFANKNNLKPEEKYILKYITKNDIKISSQPGGPDFSALNESQAIITFKNDIHQF